MHLHIGGNKIVPITDIVGIFDIRIKNKPCNKEFLETIKTESIIEDGENIASFVITPGKVYYSPIAASTLKKRFYHKFSIQ